MSKYIYHYTTIDTLALILENKTLRLNSLANVDDMEEGQAGEFRDMSKYIFVSSWTKDIEENIPLWKMYTPDMAGVRIGIDSAKIKLEKNNNNNVINIDSSNEILAFQNGLFFDDVKYDDTPISLFDSNGKITRETLAKLGKQKSKKWEFQKEARFVLMGLRKELVEDDTFFPSCIQLETRFFELCLHKPSLELSENNGFSSLTHYFLTSQLNISYIDLKLSEEVWNNIEIILGPKTTPDNQDRVQSLVKKYVPSDLNPQIKKSSLKIRYSNS